MWTILFFEFPVSFCIPPPFGSFRSMNLVPFLPQVCFLPPTCGVFFLPFQNIPVFVSPSTCSCGCSSTEKPGRTLLNLGPFFPPLTPQSCLVFFLDAIPRCYPIFFFDPTGRLRRVEGRFSLFCYNYEVDPGRRCRLTSGGVSFPASLKTGATLNAITF